ncbi:hypothetical protein WJX72_008535 [[Myrmecia] bisecta]|uniref:Molybdopterin synthase catalytic subunit n=1 Tax=[Myrmecia] bisecta TaxID=41462 RepID=A0AAW1QSX6_9CHLO
MLVEVVSDPLKLERYTEAVEDSGAGAIATFSGVTRDNFEGKKVTQLEYEAYVPMAEKQLRALCQAAACKWTIKRVAIAHRTGLVRIGEASVIIAVSSAHRREALEAVHWLIDELKATVPIWKKEVYEDGTVWKENAECRRLLAPPQ